MENEATLILDEIGFAERRSGLDRRVYTYARHIPERRAGIDRRQRRPNAIRGIGTIATTCDPERHLSFKS